MKALSLFVVSLFFFTTIGCKKESGPTAPIIPDGTTINFAIDEYGMPNLRGGEFYFLWLKVSSDTTWKPIDTLTIKYNSNIAVMVGAITIIPKVDSIKDVLVTIERTKNPITPGVVILEGHNFHFDSTNKTLSALLDHATLFGDYSSLQGSFAFTSKSTDTLAYTHEFYLMNISGSNQSASLISLTAPPFGWKYGLWAEDLNFTPHEFFFYGLFSSSFGHDSDSTNDSYPYPGGWKPQAMNMPSGNIIVTLEPPLYGDSLKFKGPSPFVLLNFNRIKFIEKNKNYPMVNVSALNIPSGSITFQQY